mmetsp:Transcript_281/g.267  ORF Transcript_281/g.267 Transcript_281/m.267 type:complete len:80 (-) Transcript_281:53-292(-)
MALYSIKALFTYFKAYQPTLTTQRDIHYLYEKSEKVTAERYDKMIETITQKVKNEVFKRKIQTAKSGKRDHLSTLQRSK